MSHKSFITAHVLDSTVGKPATGVEVVLADAKGEEIARAVTNDDGRVPELGPQTLEAGEYRITFGVGEYFAGQQKTSFYPRATIEFTVEAGQEHYHIPLLLSPFAYSTYRGS